VALGHGDRSLERGLHQLAAGGTVALTLVSFVLALWTGFIR